MVKLHILPQKQGFQRNFVTSIDWKWFIYTLSKYSVNMKLVRHQILVEIHCAYLIRR